MSSEKITDQEILMFVEAEWLATSDWLKSVLDGNSEIEYPQSVIDNKSKKLRILERIGGIVSDR